MAFPRLNALSFWLLPIAGVMFLASFLAPGGAFATGWTSYAPLASEQPIGQIFFNMGVQWAGASSILTALNFLVTIITMRAPGMTFWRMPLLVWANFTTSLLVVIATPFIAGSQFFVMFDRVMHTAFFTPVEGGYVLGYQHIFWFYSHPAVYIMMLPGFGIVSEIISVMSRKPIFGYRLMALSLLGILVLGFSVWAHHMFVAGMADWLRVPMMVTTLLIAIPTGIKVFSWIATLWEGKITLNTPMLFALGFVSMFVIGGLSGIYLAAVPIDIHASDTYFVVAHIHYVLFGGSVLTIFAGIYYWFPKMTGRMYSETLGKWHFWLTFIAFNATFFPMHWVGLRGMPRRVFDYSAEFATLNLIVSVASFVLGASVILFLYNMIVSWARGPIAEANPYRAMTLEWQVSSPPPIFNFDEIPQVVGGPYEYGVPGARHAVLKGGVPRGGVDVTDETPSVVLVVANETLAGGELVRAVKGRAENGPIQAIVIAPVNEPSAGYVVYENSRRQTAGRRLDAAVKALQAAGIPARGDVFEGGPLAAVKDVLAQEHVDELIVSTHPETKSGWLRRNLIDEIVKVAGDRPVAHIVISEVEKTGAQNVLVVANETVLGAPLLDPDPPPCVGGPGRVPDHLPAVRSAGGRTSRGGASSAHGAQRVADVGDRGPRADCAPGSVLGGHAGGHRRARRRDHRLHVPRRALRLVAPRPRRAAARRDEAARRARDRRPVAAGGDGMTSHAEPVVSHGDATGTTITTARRSRTAAPGSTRRCSACSCSSPPRRCCSARSSPPTSSCASSTRSRRSSTRSAGSTGCRARSRSSTAPAWPATTSFRSSSPGSTRRSSSRRASRCTGRCSRSGATTAAVSRPASC